MEISIVGTGYVGLVTGLCLSDKGHKVTCIDNDKAKLELLKKSQVPFYEVGVDKLLENNNNKSIFFSDNLKTTLAKTDIIFIAVGTPFKGDMIDLSYVKEVAKEIGLALKDINKYKTIVIKSTVVPGTSLNVVGKIISDISGLELNKHFGIGMCPEFLREGCAVEDCMNPDRIVIGSENDKSLNIINEVFSVFKDVDIINTSCTTAEIIKYASNSFLATCISFSNEISNYCVKHDNVDVQDVLRGVHLDRRISPIDSNGDRTIPQITTYLQASRGFGGSCFPKDVKALISDSRDKNYEMKILQSVIEINEAQPSKMINIYKSNQKNYRNQKVGVLGLSFKSGTDDMRESPALKLIHELNQLENIIYAHDPVSIESAKKVLKDIDIIYCENIDDILPKVSTLFIMTDWKDYKELPNLLKNSEHQPLVIDGIRMLDKKSVLRYEGIGLKK